VIAVIQRVSRASVAVRDEVVGEIGKGLLVLLCVVLGDTEADADWMANRIGGLRVFADEDYKMNLSVRDVRGEILLISQFTLGATMRGRRPSFEQVAPPDMARSLYERLATELKKDLEVRTGVFREIMSVSSVNDGPVTLIMDTRHRN
jgi:D-tyrosyl-tRNA(Tyr) deacylase